LPSGTRRARWAPAVALAAALSIFFVGTGANYSTTVQATVAVGYGQGTTLSDLERAGLAAADDYVTEHGGGMVMNDPHDGCGWAYPLTGMRVVFPAPLTGPFDWANLGYDRMRLFEQFDELDTSSQIRTDARNLEIGWVVLCDGFIRTWQGRAPGLDTVATMNSASLVYGNPVVRLYRVDIDHARTRS